MPESLGELDADKPCVSVHSAGFVARLPCRLLNQGNLSPSSRSNRPLAETAQYKRVAELIFTSLRCIRRAEKILCRAMLNRPFLMYFAAIGLQDGLCHPIDPARFIRETAWRTLRPDRQSRINLTVSIVMAELGATISAAIATLIMATLTTAIAAVATRFMATVAAVNATVASVIAAVASVIAAVASVIAAVAMPFLIARIRFELIPDAGRYAGIVGMNRCLGGDFSFD
jgi:hypothetical protein